MLYKKSKETFNDLHMNLRGYQSNSAQFNQLVPEEDRESEETLKILGIPWSSTTDKLHMDIRIEMPRKVSRRTVSSTIAGIFDPLGLLVPIVLPMKLFQRELWNDTYQWDTSLVATDEEKWNTIVEQANGFQIELPRHVIDKSGQNMLVTFTDASNEAAACCIYILNSLGSHLIFAKSKVRPIKESWTTPKLETQALKMGTQHTKTILKAIRDGQIQVTHSVILTDSQIALDWLKSVPGKKETGVFINNRLMAIRSTVAEMEDTIAVTFGHVRSEENPADMGTRGSDKDTFEKSMWWNGPKFLQQDQSAWPIKQFSIAHPDCLMNLAKKDIEDTSEKVFDCSRTRDFSKMKRIVAWCLRFIKRITKKPSESAETLSAEEIRAAEIILIRDQQKDITSKNLKDLGHLGLETDDQGLIVCRGRLEMSSLPDDARFPILILPNSDIGHQIILDSHGKYHQCLHHTMDTFRRRFWMPKLRQQTKILMKRCVPCQKVNKLPVRYPDMGRLPKARIQRTTPFQNIGLDYFGPIGYKKEDGTEGAAHGAIFTCSVTRLTHIEIVPDKSAKEFIQALRRLIAIRGCPTNIVSDNGTCFVLGQKILEDTIKQDTLPPEITEFLGIQEISWKFITAYAPWKGGQYERMVKIAKQAFKKAFSRKVLHYEELQTVFHEVAASMNTRPLTYPEEDFQSSLPIRLIDFISQQMKVTIPFNQAMDIRDEYRPPEELQTIQCKRDTIEALSSSIAATEKVWKIWNSKYLAELREQHRLRMNNKRGSPHLPKVGAIVLICDENLPRNYWRIGKIETITSSEDGVVRDVSIKTAGGRIINRTINLIVPLEMDQEFEEEELPHQEMEVPKPENRRYNLRKRERVNYDQERTSTCTIRSLPSLLQVVMLACVLGLPVAAEKALINCNAQGLQISGHYKDFEVCTENYCTSKTRYAWTSGHQKRDIWLPPSIKIHPHHNTIKINLGTNIQVVELDCPAIPFCDTIDCTLCMSNILNPECHISFAIVGLGAIAFLMLMMIHMICNVPVTLGAPFKIAWSITRIFWTLLMRVLINAVNKFRRQRRSKWRTIVVIMMMTTAILKVETCQEIDIISQFEDVCDTEGNCHKMTENVLTLNSVHNEGCLQVDKNGTTLRDIRIKLLNIEITCKKRSITFTKDIETKVWSVKRCPHTGSCTGNKCEDIGRTSRVPELEEVRNYTGNTACSESCGGPGCGCFFMSSGCMFYKIYAYPKSTEEFEIFECIEFQPTAKILLTVSTLNSFHNSIRTREMDLPIGRTDSFMQIAVSVETIQTPPSPLLNSWYIRGNSSMSTWTPQQIPNLRCDEKWENCVLQEDCKCNPAENQMKCVCTDYSIGQHMLRTEQHLPIQSGYWRLETKGDTVRGTIMTDASMRVTVRMTDTWKTIIVKSVDKCHFSTSPITGCYSCSKGASAEIVCHSDHSETMAEIDCDKVSFVIPCSPNGVATNITFFSDTAKISRSCSAGCGGKESQSLEMSGILKYSASIWTSIYRLIEGNTTVYNEINMPDVNHLLNCYFAYIKTVMLVLIGAVILLLVTYSTITCAGQRAVRFLVTTAWNILKIPLRIFNGLRQRRHGHLHLHVILCMILLSPTTSSCLSSPRFSEMTTAQITIDLLQQIVESLHRIEHTIADAVYGPAAPPDTNQEVFTE